MVVGGLLGKPADGQPAFHDWLRGLAFHRAGDYQLASAAFERYFTAWPGDMIGGAATAALVPARDHD